MLSPCCLAGLAESWEKMSEDTSEDKPENKPEDRSHDISRYCSNYSRILDSRGNNILKGLIAFEGCLAVTFTEAGKPSSLPPPPPTPTPLDIGLGRREAHVNLRFPLITLNSIEFFFLFSLQTSALPSVTG